MSDQITEIRNSRERKFRYFARDDNGKFATLFSLFLEDFDVNSADLKQEHEEQLSALLLFIAQYHTIEIINVIGRASQTGGNPLNDPLSLQRARNVAIKIQELIGFAIDSSRIISLGKRSPIEESFGLENSTNRSVEIVYEITFNDLSAPLTDTEPKSRMWNINLSSSVGIGDNIGKFARLGWVENIYSGTLSMRQDPNIISSENQTKHISVFTPGITLSYTLPLPIMNQISGRHNTASSEGDFELDEAVGWSYWNGRGVWIVDLEAGLVASSSLTLILDFNDFYEGYWGTYWGDATGNTATFGLGIIMVIG